MTEIEKELFVESLKQSFRNNYPKKVADEMCMRLDMAKHDADAIENIFKLYQQCFQQFCEAYRKLW